MYVVPVSGYCPEDSPVILDELVIIASNNDILRQRSKMLDALNRTFEMDPGPYKEMAMTDPDFQELVGEELSSSSE